MTERLHGVTERLHGVTERLHGVTERLHGVTERLQSTRFAQQNQGCEALTTTTPTEGRESGAGRCRSGKARPALPRSSRR